MSKKTTIYLPDRLKAAVEREARVRGCSEAQVIREAVQDAVSRPRPNAGIVSGEPCAEQADEQLAGFGDR
ncbi:MAG: ribbon-helix-helix protein, CopG family [Acidimicrobiia bacterium]|nr:ribbon-helix-helix protein, CopG family [Acidimicrobiia bacterium]